jgi:hypothetical protein
MRTVIAMCTMVIGLGLAGFAVSTHGYSALNVPELAVPAVAEDGAHACLIDYDTPCSVR